MGSARAQLKQTGLAANYRAVASWGRVPSDEAWRDMFDCSQGAITGARSHLESEGWKFEKDNDGSFVAVPPDASDMDEAESRISKLELELRELKRKMAAANLY